MFWRLLHLNWFCETLAFTEREYFSLGVNMLKNSIKIPDTTNKEFFELIFFRVTKNYGKNTAVQI